MEIIRNPTQVEIKKAAQALKDGHLVAFPTETVYGLGADATNEKAVSRVYSVKARPTDHPLIVHISSIEQIDKWAIKVPKYAVTLARTFWPGPMTLILKRSELAKNFVTGNQDSVGLRAPAHPIALSLLREFEKFGGLGVGAPSANMFRAVSPTSSEEVQDEIGKLLGSSDIILDGAQSQVGIESTIIDCTSEFPTILRPGSVTIEMIESIISFKVKLQNNNLLKVSGSFNTHFAPKTKILLDVPALSGQGFLALANVVTPPGAIRISSPKSINEYASVLYASFRLVDKLKLEYLVVITPEGEGLAVAVRDRLRKAAFK